MDDRYPGSDARAWYVRPMFAAISRLLAYLPTPTPPQALYAPKPPFIPEAHTGLSYQRAETMTLSTYVIARLVRATRRGTMRLRMARTSLSLRRRGPCQDVEGAVQ
jgi:hypothetical protein